MTANQVVVLFAHFALGGHRRMTRHHRQFLVLAVGLLSLGMGCNKKEEGRHPGQIYVTNTSVTLALDPGSLPPTCYGSNPGPSIPANDVNATIVWTTAPDDKTTYYVTFSGANPLLNRGGTPAAMPIVVTSGGSAGGPFTLSSAAVTACTSVASPNGCYLSYDISLQPGGNSCELHGVGYYTGIHITR